MGLLMPLPADRAGFSMVVTAVSADIDELGHVNNTAYLRWVQDVATAHWRAVARAEDIDRASGRALRVPAHVAAPFLCCVSDPRYARSGSA